MEHDVEGAALFKTAVMRAPLLDSRERFAVQIERFPTVDAAFTGAALRQEIIIIARNTRIFGKLADFRSRLSIWCVGDVQLLLATW